MFIELDISVLLSYFLSLAIAAFGFELFSNLYAYRSRLDWEPFRRIGALFDGVAFMSLIWYVGFRILSEKTTFPFKSIILDANYVNIALWAFLFGCVIIFYLHVSKITDREKNLKRDAFLRRLGRVPISMSAGRK